MAIYRGWWLLGFVPGIMEGNPPKDHVLEDPVLSLLLIKPIFLVMPEQNVPI